ncbi:hypothetical protein BJY00DRAFT_272563 [Aspergillus carlsbadensis]|nr:hypothetical protein BJY00DRAFT_272563 [Aspergillus carlsbadensis]
MPRKRKAAHGQACLHCFKTKSKCVKLSSDSSCERCARLKKECEPADSLRKKTSQKTFNADALLAELEENVPGLTAFLYSATENFASSLPPVLSEAIERRRQIQQNMEREREGEGEEKPRVGEIPAPLGYGQLSQEEEQNRLSIFRNRKLKNLAFIYLPSDLTVQQLRKEKPLLTEAIMAITCSSFEEKRFRADGLEKLIRQASTEDTASSLDLLLCALTYVAWGYHHLVKPGMNHLRLPQLIASLANELCSEKPLLFRSDEWSDGVPFSSQRGFDPGLPIHSAQQSLEEERAVLGCFIMISICSFKFGQMSPLRWTPQLAGYLNDIEKARQCPTDEILAIQVRLQLLTQQASEQRNHWYQETTPSMASNFAEPFPSSLHFKTFRTKLQDIEASIPQTLREHKLVIAYLNEATVNIYETIYAAYLDFDHPNCPPLSSLHLLQCHLLSLEALDSWLNNFFTFSTSDYLDFNFGIWMQLMRSLSVLLRLSIPSDSGRDHQIVRKTANVLVMVDRALESLHRASIDAKETSPKDLFGTFCNIARSFRAHAVSQLRNAEQEQAVFGAGNQVEEDCDPPEGATEWGVIEKMLTTNDNLARHWLMGQCSRPF